MSLWIDDFSTDTNSNLGGDEPRPAYHSPEEIASENEYIAGLRGGGAPSSGGLPGGAFGAWLLSDGPLRGYNAEQAAEVWARNPQLQGSFFDAFQRGSMGTTPEQDAYLAQAAATYWGSAQGQTQLGWGQIEAVEDTWNQSGNAQGGSQPYSRRAPTTGAGYGGVNPSYKQQAPTTVRNAPPPSGGPLPPGGGPLDPWAAIIAELTGGGANTLSRDQFEAQQAQFAQTLALSQQQLANQTQQLIETNRFNQASLAEAVNARQSRDAQIYAQMAQSQAQFERSFSLQQQQLGLSTQQIQAQIEDSRGRLAIMQQQLGLDTRRIDIQVSQFAQQFGLAQRGQEFSQGLAAGELTGTYNGQPTLARRGQEFGQQMDLSRLAANPRSMVQGLIALGLSPDEAATTLNSLPRLRGMYSQAGITPPGDPLQGEALRPNPGGLITGTPTPSTPSPSSGGGSPLTGSPGGNQLQTMFPTGFNEQGRNRAFPFISGHNLPVRDTLNARQSNNQPYFDSLSSLASFSGQDPNAFFGDFQQALPKGNLSSLTSFYG